MISVASVADAIKRMFGVQKLEWVNTLYLALTGNYQDCKKYPLSTCGEGNIVLVVLTMSVDVTYLHPKF